MKTEKPGINFNLVKSILTGVWMIDQRAAISYAPELANILSGKKTVIAFEGEEDEENEEGEQFDYWLRAVRGDTNKLDKRVNTYNDLPENSIAVINLTGPLMKSDAFCGPAGTATKAEMLRSAFSSKKVSGAILVADTPGGHVDGTEEMARVAKEFGKPLVTYVDGLMASAGYWIGSAADHIMASGKTTEIGSIGTMISLADIMPVLKKAGVKFHNVRASKSSDKNETYYQLLEGNYEPIKKEVLDPLNEIFLATVRANRGDKLVDPNTENVLTGKVYLAEQAIEYGLIDSIGTFDDAVAKVRTLRKESESENNFITNKETMKIKAGWSAIMAFLGITTEQVKSEEDAPVITEENIEQLNTELAQRGDTITAVTELFGEAASAEGFNVVDAVKALQTEKQAAVDAKAVVDAELVEEKKKVKVAVTPEKTGDDAVDDDEDDAQAILDALPHNQAADDILG